MTEPKVFPLGNEGAPRASRCPAGLDAAGRRLWKRLVTSDLIFRQDELVLIEQACVSADKIELLRGLLKVKAAKDVLVQLRLEQDHLRKLLRSIDWPQDDDDAGSRSSAGRALVMHRWRKGASA